MQARGKSRNQEAPPRAGLFVVDTASIRALYLSRTEQPEHDTMNEAIARADAELNNAGLPTYTEVVQMLREAQRLGLNFDIGNAYIRRAYIDKQTELNARIARTPAV